MLYRLRSGALHCLDADNSTVVVPKLDLLDLHEAVDPKSVGFEYRKGQNLHKVVYKGQALMLYVPVMKVFPDKDNPEYWVDNALKVLLELV